jgi:hypothetical protein
VEGGDVSKQVPGRAPSADEKRAVIERLLAAWLAVPELRLGQLLANAVGHRVFYIEDEGLACEVEAFVRGTK